MKDEFLHKFKGRFSGVLKWEQLDRLWSLVRKNHNAAWYLYHVGDQPPTSPASSHEVNLFIDKIDQLLRSEHQESYCGIIYADDLNNPTFVKIFDPNNLGVSCGFSDNPPLPGWIMTQIPPVDLPTALPPPQNRKRWWRKLFAHN